MSKNRNNRREWTDDKVSTEDIGSVEEELGLTGEEPKDTLLDGVEEAPVKEELETQTELPVETETKTTETETKEELGEVSVEVGSLDDFYKALFRLENKNVNGIQELLNSLVLKDAADKLFVAELKDIVRFLIANDLTNTNKANQRLNSLILRILESKDTLKFNIINKLFEIDNKVFEPSYLIRTIEFTRDLTTVLNYGQLITIIEVLANPETRVKNKSLVPNLTNLKLKEEALNFLNSFNIIPFFNLFFYL
jgi:hypothetical protein